MITSGTRSPTLRKNVALCRMAVQYAEPGTAVEVGKLDGHQKRIPATVVRFPFYDPEKTAAANVAQGLAEPLVAAAVEQQRLLALRVAGVLDAAEEQRVVAAPVGAGDVRDEVRQRALDERRVVDDLEARLRRRRRRRGPRSGPTARSASRTGRSRRTCGPRGAGRTSSCGDRPR